MPEIVEVRLAGFGGQGIVLAGVLLGQAGTLDGKFVAGSNSYGAQARGSACKAEVILSDGPIDYPHVIMPDILVAMSQGAYNLFSREVKEPSGVILYDRTLVKVNDTLKPRQVGIAATEHAIKKLKNKQMANIVLLGALVQTIPIVSPKALQKSIRIHVTERFRDLNLKALRAGMALGRQVDG